MNEQEIIQRGVEQSFQADTAHLCEGIVFANLGLIRGSWMHSQGLRAEDKANWQGWQRELYHGLNFCRQQAAAMETDRDRLGGLIDNPHTNDFLEAVRLEAAHQVRKWGEAHDRGKSAENWFWLVGYLAGKALRAAITGDHKKALHHTISSGAALLNWHKAISADITGTCIGDDRDLVELDRFKSSFAAQGAPESQPVAATASIATRVALTIRDLCELDPPDPDEPDAIIVSIGDLRIVLERALLAREGGE